MFHLTSIFTNTGEPEGESMSTLWRYYQGRFGDYGTMQACRSASDEHKEWTELCGRKDRRDWQDKHQCWIYEPLGVDLNDYISLGVTDEELNDPFGELK